MKASMGRRVTGSVLDQALSSATNFVVLFAALRWLSIDGVGIFTIAYTSALTVMAISRALLLQPLAVRFSGETSSHIKTAAEEALGASLSVGLSLVFLAGTLWGAGLNSLGPPFLAAAVATVVLLLQDGWRFYYFISSYPWRAVFNDGIRLVSTIAAILFVRQLWHITVPHLLLAWAVGAVAACMHGWLSTRIRPRITRTARWIRGTRSIGLAFAVDVIVERLGAQFSLGIVGIIGGAGTLGRIGAARTLMSPITTVTTAVDIFALPEMSRLEKASSSRSMAFSVALSVGLGSAIMAFTAVALLVPVDVGRFLAGPNWEFASKFLLPIGVWTAASGARQGPRILLKALEEPRKVLTTSLASACVLVTMTTIGSSMGATEASWAFATGYLVSLVLWWSAAVSSLRAARQIVERSHSEPAL